MMVKTYRSREHVVHECPQTPPVHRLPVTRSLQDLWSPKFSEHTEQIMNEECAPVENGGRMATGQQTPVLCTGTDLPTALCSTTYICTSYGNDLMPLMNASYANNVNHSIGLHNIA